MMLLNCDPTGVVFCIMLELERHIHNLDTLSATGIVKQGIEGLQRLKDKSLSLSLSALMTVGSLIL